MDPMNRTLREADPEVAQAVLHETERQSAGLEQIASENFVSEAVLEAMGSVFTNKYAEGYPGRRYYGGCEHTDVVERLALERAKQLFGAEHANVQPHSGSQANQAVYLTVLQPGDTVLGMDLSHGGHLTHGHPLNLSGKLYRFVAYGVRKDDERLDYDALEAAAREHRPKLIVCGIIEFVRKMLVHEGAVVIRFGRPHDPFGNDVDDDGGSRDRAGRRVDPRSYLMGADGEPVVDDQRDAEYTRLLGRRLAEAYPRETVFHSTHLVVRVGFDAVAAAAGPRDIFRLLRLPTREIPVPDAIRALGDLRRRIVDTPAAGRLHQRVAQAGDAVILDDAARALSTYHTHPVVASESQLPAEV